MKKYLIMRKKGELANEVFHLIKDVSSDNTFTVSWFTRKTKKIKTKDEIINYHLNRINQIMKSKYLVVEPTTRNSINDLVEICKQKTNKNDNYSTDEICLLAEITYKKIASPILFSIFSMKLNFIEWIAIIFILIICKVLV